MDGWVDGWMDGWMRVGCCGSGWSGEQMNASVESQMCKVSLYLPLYHEGVRKNGVKLLFFTTAPDESEQVTPGCNCFTAGKQDASKRKMYLPLPCRKPCVLFMA